MALKKSGLGKGLDAIFMENDLNNPDMIKTLRLSEVEPNRNQPRKAFKEEALIELADSISKHGVIQPLIVRKLENGRYQIIAGERRWRAARMAALSEIPVVVKDLSDVEVMQIALIENLQREDLSVIEEAKGYKMLMDTYNFTQDEVSKAVGKSRSNVANVLRLLCLPKKVIDFLEEGSLSAGHARALLALKKDADIEKFADIVVNQGLSVREVEKMIQNVLNKKNSRCKTAAKRDTGFDEVELSLKECLGRKVKVVGNSAKKGVLQIEFYGKDDLFELARLLGREKRFVEEI